MMRSILGIGSAPLIAAALTGKNSIVSGKGKKALKPEYLDQNICLLSTNSEKIPLIEIKCTAASIAVCAYSNDHAPELVDMYVLTNKTLAEFVKIFYEFYTRY